MSDPVFLTGAITLVVFSITTHEAAHGFVADKLGDPTARLMGRLTLNPIPHIDFFMTILLPAVTLLGAGVAFGGAKPVPVDIRNLRKPWRDWALVGLAGPTSNILLGLLFAGLFSLFVHTGRAPETVGAMVLAVAMYFNFFLATFNLLPIPPLDGSRVLQFFLTPSGRQTLFQIERFGLFILVGLIVIWDAPLQAWLRYVTVPLLDATSAVFGIESELAQSLNAAFPPRHP